MHSVTPWGTATGLRSDQMTTNSDILVIEDDAIMREAVAEWLRAAGYGVRTAEDGNAGLACVNVAAPSLVVTDIHMPGKNGALVIGELKQQSSGNSDHRDLRSFPLRIRNEGG